MERALWKNREYYASDVVEKFEIEEAIRKASNKELFCTDPDCENPLLRYCHGEKKRAYFAHITNSNCDYADFERKNQFIQKIRYKLFDLFRSKGYDIRMEPKLLPKHYSGWGGLEEDLREVKEALNYLETRPSLEELLEEEEDLTEDTASSAEPTLKQ
jgi:hypothetical protein